MANALTAIPFAATGLLPARQPIALATLIVGNKEFSAAGRVGEGPNVCSVAAVSCSLQAASGTASPAMRIASRRFLEGRKCLRMLVSPVWRYNTRNRHVLTVSAEISDGIKGAACSPLTNKTSTRPGGRKMTGAQQDAQEAEWHRWRS